MLGTPWVRRNFVGSLFEGPMLDLESYSVHAALDLFINEPGPAPSLSATADRDLPIVRRGSGTWAASSRDRGAEP